MRELQKNNSSSDQFAPITNRTARLFRSDRSAVAALLQAACNIEVFSLPIYLNAMSSLHGTHEKGIDETSLYSGRIWPGLIPRSGSNLSVNQTAYNIIYAIFLQKFLHLEQISNIATMLGIQLNFFYNTTLENSEGGWEHFQHGNTLIPHLFDLKDTINKSEIRVKASGLSREFIEIHDSITQHCEVFWRNIRPEKINRYIHTVPLENWSEDSSIDDLPLFGNIACLYNTLITYITIRYDDGELLWEKMFKPEQLKQQKKFFNSEINIDPELELPLTPTGITSSNSRLAVFEVLNLIEIIISNTTGAKNNVTAHCRSALKSFYFDEFNISNYHATNTSFQRLQNIGTRLDQRVALENLRKLLPTVETWETWLKKNKKWKARHLVNSNFAKKHSSQNIPSATDVAKALNELRKLEPAELDRIASNALINICSAFSKPWFQEMTALHHSLLVSTQDRIVLYWAVYGRSPELKEGLPRPKPGAQYHACQGLSFEKPEADSASYEAFHSCHNANSCKALGGCGYPQYFQDSSDNTQEQTTPQYFSTDNPFTDLYSAPGANSCASFGGGAVPISASQLFQEPGLIIINNNSEPYVISFEKGEAVYDIAWEAFSEIMLSQNIRSSKPKPSLLRQALPPNLPPNHQVKS